MIKQKKIKFIPVSILLVVIVFVLFGGYLLLKKNLTSLFVSPAEAASTSASLIADRCFAGQDSWRTSNQLKTDAKWSLWMILPPLDSNSNSLTQFIDLNADGLPDYINMRTFGGYSRECVLLNNGQGWDPAFRCVYQTDSQGVDHFYGDCAQ